jgi:hypothetical protein
VYEHADPGHPSSSTPTSYYPAPSCTELPVNDLGLTLALLVVLALIEFLGRRPGQRTGELSTS